jgi:hypothetical protein
VRELALLPTRTFLLDGELIAVAQELPLAQGQGAHVLAHLAEEINGAEAVPARPVPPTTRVRRPGGPMPELLDRPDCEALRRQGH